MAETPRPSDDGTPGPMAPNPAAQPGNQPAVPPQPGYQPGGQQPGYQPPVPPQPGSPPPAPGYQPGYPPGDPGFPPGGSGFPPGGSGFPPGGSAGGSGYPPGGSAGGSGYPPPGYASGEEKTWVLVAHFGGALGMLVGFGWAGWIAPLIVLLAKGNESPAIRSHAVPALNFQILWAIVALVGHLLWGLGIGILVVYAAVAMGVIFGIVAGLKANEGVLYNYPFNQNFVR